MPGSLHARAQMCVCARARVEGGGWVGGVLSRCAFCPCTLLAASAALTRCRLRLAVACCLARSFDCALAPLSLLPTPTCPPTLLAPTPLDPCSPPAGGRLSGRHPRAWASAGSKTCAPTQIPTPQPEPASSRPPTACPASRWLRMYSASGFPGRLRSHREAARLSRMAARVGGAWVHHVQPAARDTPHPTR